MANATERIERLAAQRLAQAFMSARYHDKPRIW